MQYIYHLSDVFTEGWLAVSYHCLGAHEQVSHGIGHLYYGTDFEVHKFTYKFTYSAVQSSI